jgi:hypothetical protein
MIELRARLPQIHPQIHPDHPTRALTRTAHPDACLDRRPRAPSGSFLRVHQRPGGGPGASFHAEAQNFAGYCSLTVNAETVLAMEAICPREAANPHQTGRQRQPKKADSVHTLRKTKHHQHDAYSPTIRDLVSCQFPEPITRPVVCSTQVSPALARPFSVRYAVLRSTVVNRIHRKGSGEQISKWGRTPDWSSRIDH